MVILNNNDMFSVRLATLVADYDYETITNLYQPLIGHVAVSLYFTFLSEAKYQKVTSFNQHESLFAKMQMSTGDFLKARKSLEAVGLLRSFLEETNGAKIYYYEVFAPKTPAEFFTDTLLYGLLINYIGENDAKRLNQYYATSINNKGKEISSSFKDVFHPDFESQAFIKALNSAPSLGRNRARMKLEFSFDQFFASLKDISQISEKAFSKGELNEILRLTSLYGVDEITAANVIANCYDPSKEKGKRVDFKEVTKSFQDETHYSYLARNNNQPNKPNIVNSKGNLGKKINIMETVSPKDYLSILQNGTEPALPDLKLLDYLSKKFRLTNAVLNAVIDYTLLVNNNVLSKPYMEKICASIAREGITTAIDAMNYLKSISKASKKKKNVELEEEHKVTAKPNNEKSDNSDEEWDSLMAELDDMEDSGDDGKA